MGGARRDEEKARAKERFFSHRDEFGQWDPKNQSPELWNLFNGRKHYGEHFRVFPISNWTEMDVWEYIKLENIELPSLYFSHQRDCVVRDGVILAYSQYIKLKEGEEVKTMNVRFRTCGDMPITGAVESKAATLQQVIDEISVTRTTERGGRAMIKEQKLLWKMKTNLRVLEHINMEKYNKELLRFTTAGSVDDGKSTLYRTVTIMIVNQFFKTSWMLLKSRVKNQAMIMLIYLFLQMV